ncbi:MAG: hypothetical protein LBQ84_09155 [Flavobacteriaceae bacterium]|jgi:hypothetical protein|nr:hypothetical protein [Flavobacteriaceae bacterium]
MHDIIKTFDINELPKESQKLMGKFLRKLDSLYTPFKAKNIEKLKEFAADEHIVSYILNRLQSYDIAVPYEVRPIGGLWVVLALSNNDAAYDYLESAADYFINVKPIGISELYRLCGLFPANKRMHGIHKKITAYYDSIRGSLSSYVWAQSIGLPLPEVYEWFIRFMITTDGKAFVIGKIVTDNGKAHVIEPEEKEKRFSIDVEAFSPITMNDTYRIHFSNDTQTIKGIFRDKDIVSNTDLHRAYFIDHNKEYSFDTDLQHLKEFILEMEERYGIKFVRKFALSYATKGINKKIIQKWIDE